MEDKFVKVLKRCSGKRNSETFSVAYPCLDAGSEDDDKFEVSGSFSNPSYNVLHPIDTDDDVENDDSDDEVFHPGSVPTGSDRALDSFDEDKTEGFYSSFLDGKEGGDNNGAKGKVSAFLVFLHRSLWKGISFVS